MTSSCFSGILECIQGPSYGATASYKNLMDASIVRLNPHAVGTNVVLVKDGKRICGEGGALCNAPIMQDKAYFDVKIQQTGIWGVGLASSTAHIDVAPVVDNAWVLRHDGVLCANREERTLDEEGVEIEEGDVIGLTYDHIELVFYRNGQRIGQINGVKGTVYPVIYVAQEAIVDVQFQNFAHKPPSGFAEILMEQTIL